MNPDISGASNPDSHHTPDEGRLQASLQALLQLPKDDAAIPRRIPLYRRALTLIPRETEQELWATLQYELADCLVRSQDRDRAQNLEEAIRRYQAVLEVWSRDDSPQKWAQVLHDMGSALRFRVHGDHRENLKRAIRLYELALHVRTPETSPEGWAATQICLGIAWKDLPVGDRRKNQERALKHYQAALKVWSRKTNPVGWARVQHNLGNLCNQFVAGDRILILERALKHYRLALKIRTRDAHPLAWAMTQVAMANTYVERIKGDRAENLERAIELYQQALEVRTREARPAEWAEAQYDLAVAYRLRIRGDRAENQEKAIAHYSLALKVHTRQTFPAQWATARTDLGLVYYRRLRGDRAENLERAIKLFIQALEVRTRDALPEQWATTQLCLANAYCDRIQGNRAKNLEQAIEHYELALEVRSRENFPYEWAMIRNNLGTAYWERIEGQRAQNLAHAIQLFGEALEVHTPGAFPVDARRAARNLGDLYFGEGWWNKAHAAYTTALKAAEALYTAAFMEAGREAEIGENAALYVHDAFCLAHLGQFEKALVRLEEGKTRTLAERLGRDAAQLQKARPEDQKAYRDLLNRLKALEVEQQAGSDNRALVEARRAYTQVARDVELARQELNALIHRINDYLPDFLPGPLDFATIQTLVPGEQAALVEFCVTEKGCVVLVVRSEGKPEPVWIEGFTRSDLNHIIRDWVEAYQSRDSLHWQTTIERVLNQVGLRLITPLHTMLQKYGTSCLILIPQGSLFLLPLHAAPVGEDSACLLDCYQVSYAPSATVLQRCHERATYARAEGLFAVADPTCDLAFAGHEVRAIASLFGEPKTTLWQEQATKEATLTYAGEHGYVHFSCHGQYDWDEPSHSALLLAGSLAKDEAGRQGINYERALTLAEVEAGLNLDQTRLVTLSACETGLTEAIGPRAEEYVGLPAGFLLAGAPAVVASLWAVDDLSTAMLMERFYHYHLHGDPDSSTQGPLPLVAALRRAQIWLCKATVDEIDGYLAETRDREGSEASRLIRSGQNHDDSLEGARPFKSPYYWAAFAISGAEATRKSNPRR
jgi:CHAT domain-containing protein